MTKRLNRIESLVVGFVFQMNKDASYQRREKAAAVRNIFLRGTEQMFAAYFPHLTEHNTTRLLERSGLRLMQGWTSQVLVSAPMGFCFCKIQYMYLFGTVDHNCCFVEGIARDVNPICFIV